MQDEYDKDFYLWTQHQAEFIRKKDFKNIDIINLAEEIESLGGSKADSLESYLIVLMLHLLKKKYQTDYPNQRSWNLSIKNSRYRIKRIIKKNPGLKSKLNEILKDAYFTSRLGAADETGLEEKIFPKKCPWTFEELFKEE